MAIFARIVAPALVGLAATAVFAAPAAAGGPPPNTGNIHLTADKVCTGGAEDNIVVTWTISTTLTDLFDVILINAGPTGLNGITPQSGQITAGQDLKMVQTINPHVGGDAFIEIGEHVDGQEGGDTLMSQSFPSTCGGSPTATAVASCDQSGKATVVWTVTNPGSDDVTADVSNVLPAGSTIAEAHPFPLAAGASATLHQTIPAPAGAGSASIMFGFTFFNVVTHIQGNVRFECQVPPTPASPSPSAPGLPVTGAKVGTYVGIAAVLILAGGVLIVVARRRRTVS